MPGAAAEPAGSAVWDSAISLEDSQTDDVGDARASRQLGFETVRSALDLRNGHEQNAAEVDKPIAGLLSELNSRGLLEDTLVVWGGEFGRTPTCQGKRRDGRDHNPEGFTMSLAGGGVW